MAEHRHVAHSRPVPMSPQLQRELSTIMDGFWPDGQERPLDGMAEAIIKWACDRELVLLPHGTTNDTAENVAYLTSTRGDYALLHLPPATSTRPAPAPRERTPTLRELGAEPIDGDRG